ncbi:MAG TPA: hypothetical protein VLM37_05825 [Fibrobacteraceae bacterium]|nr:hypothetical protein [Fibrobacteraceae bacterium]
MLPEKLNGVQRWNLVMVVAIVTLLLVDRFAGHLVAVHEKVETGLSFFGVGLACGVFLHFWKKRGGKS